MKQNKDIAKIIIENELTSVELEELRKDKKELQEQKNLLNEKIEKTEKRIERSDKIMNYSGVIGIAGIVLSALLSFLAAIPSLPLVPVMATTFSIMGVGAVGIFACAISFFVSISSTIDKSRWEHLYSVVSPQLFRTNYEIHTLENSLKFVNNPNVIDAEVQDIPTSNNQNTLQDQKYCKVASLIKAMKIDNENEQPTSKEETSVDISD